MRLSEASTEQLLQSKTELEKKFEKYADMNLSLNISRGLPCKEQLDLNAEMFHILDETNCYAEDGTDCRQYGVINGLPECIRLFSELLDIPEKRIILGGESSLNLMYDEMLRLWAFGCMGEEPWSKQAQKQQLKWLCPVPGYDCHFTLTEKLGFELISVPMNADGPDMNLVEKLVAEDPSVKGIWCVPQYSNPTGIVYSDEVVDRLASMKTAAPDFKIIWDNAYAVHHIYKENIVKDIFKAAKPYGNENRILYFFSTAKITFPGSGVCMMASGDEMVEETKELLKLQIFSHDKLNQLRHVKYLKSPENIRTHMKKVAEILKPRFDVVDEILQQGKLYDDLYTWFKPDGGYFITVDSYPGCATEILSRLEAVGVKVAIQGSTFPYHKDPNDSNIRLAPTYPPMEELITAMKFFCVAAGLVAIEHVLKERGNS